MYLQIIVCTKLGEIKTCYDTGRLWAITQIQSIRELLKATISKVRENTVKIYSKELVNNIFEQPYTNIEYIINKLGVERKAASR